MFKETHPKSIATCVLMMLFPASAALAGIWKTFDVPYGSLVGVSDIDGSKIIGSYVDNSAHVCGFSYNGTTWTKLIAPGEDTYVYGIQGNNIVGCYDSGSLEYGCLYNGSTWSTLKAPNSKETCALGIYNGTIIGYYSDPDYFAKKHGFIYKDSTWTTLNAPGATDTYARSIDGDTIVGYYRDNYETYHGFIYDGTNYNILDMPGASQTIISGISGGKIIGRYILEEGGPSISFIYEGATWTTINNPYAPDQSIYVNGIDGDNIVGMYYDSDNQMHGFVYTIPEPATLLLLGLGAAIVSRRRR